MDEQIEVDVASRPSAAALLGAARRPATTVLTLVIVCVLIVGGATALVVRLTKASPGRATRPIAVRGVTNRPAACPPSGAVEGGPDPTRVGRWAFQLTEKGTFGSVVSGAAGTAFAIEACGAYETDLRVVRLSLGRPSPVEASAFVHAALLTSSLVSSQGSLYFGAARLDLSGSASSPPYELTVYRLDPSTMTFTASRALGRGYGLVLEADGTRIVAATGSALLSLDRSTLLPRRLAGFGRSVAQHVVADPAAGEYVVSLFTPGVVPPAVGAAIEVIAGRTGHLVSSVSLPGGSDPESLAVTGNRLWVAIGDGLVTKVRAYRLPALTALWSGQPTAQPSDEATSESITLDATGGVVWSLGLSRVECSSAVNGKMLAGTDQSGSAPLPLTQVFSNGGTVYAAGPTGIGRLLRPVACAP